jgi:hypothetical protein
MAPTPNPRCLRNRHSMSLSVCSTLPFSNGTRSCSANARSATKLLRSSRRSLAARDQHRNGRSHAISGCTSQG